MSGEKLTEWSPEVSEYSLLCLAVKECLPMRIIDKKIYLKLKDLFFCVEASSINFNNRTNHFIVFLLIYLAKKEPAQSLFVLVLLPHSPIPSTFFADLEREISPANVLESRGRKRHRVRMYGFFCLLMRRPGGRAIGSKERNSNTTKWKL